MVALTYENLGGISSVSNTSKVPASKRSRDRNDQQRLSFTCDENNPFTGIIHVQCSVSDPNVEHQYWFDICEMEINNEGGSWSYEPFGEYASIRVVCKENNYLNAAFVEPFTITTADTFRVNNTTISLDVNDTYEEVSQKFKDANVDVTVTMVENQIRFASTSPIIFENSPSVYSSGASSALGQMGLEAKTYKGGIIKSINMLR